MNDLVSNGIPKSRSKVLPYFLTIGVYLPISLL
jgi:hypothetical protein